VPSDKAGTSKYKPASGTGAGQEDFTVASDQVSEPTVKALFDADYYTTLLSIRRLPGTFNLVFAESSAMTGQGVMTEAVVNALNADDEMTVSMSFSSRPGRPFPRRSRGFGISRVSPRCPLSSLLGHLQRSALL